LGDGELIHFDGFQAAGFHLVVPPGSIAEVLEHKHLPVRATDIRRSTLHVNLLPGQLAATDLSTGTLTGDPISMPFEARGLAALDETVAILGASPIDRARGLGRGQRRAISQYLHAREFRQRKIVLASS
jgi:hypothetical protein